MSGDPHAVRTGVDRRFYTGAAIVALLLVFAGFARTYYLKGWFGTPELTLLPHIHGVIMTSWFVLFAVQTWLVSARKVAVHRRLGVAGAVLAGLVCVVGVMVAIHGAKRGSSPGPPPLVFLAIPLADIGVFAGVAGCGLWFRRTREVHRRLMLLSSLAILPPAVARIPIDAIANGGLLAAFGIPDLLIVACIAYDTWKNGRLHPAYLWGGLFVVLSLPIRLLLAGTPVWLRFATWLTS